MIAGNCRDQYELMNQRWTVTRISTHRALGRLTKQGFISCTWIMKYLGLKLGLTNKERYLDEQGSIAARFKDVPFMPARLWHTTNGWHRELDMDAEIDNTTAILIQCILDDDYRISAALLAQVERGCKDWNNLCRQKFGSRRLFPSEAFDILGFLKRYKITLRSNFYIGLDV